MKQQIFRDMLSDFFKLINENNHLLINERFHVSVDVVNEIREIVTEYFGEYKCIQVPGNDLMNKSRINKPIFDVFHMGEINHYGVECVLLDENGSETEMIFSCEFFVGDGRTLLRYKFIEM